MGQETGLEWAMNELCRDLTLAMVAQRSVTGTAGECDFGSWLEGFLRAQDRFGAAPEIWSFPVAPGDGRQVVALLIRGSGARTVVLTGHYDTVTDADYGVLMPLAGQPEALRAALLARLRGAGDAASRRAFADLESGEFLPGRGLLDMKAGLAAGLAAMAEIAKGGFDGNLLFLAVPDEENASAGARAAAARLGALAATRGLHVAAAINLDAIADDGDGTSGRVLATGTVGKVLPTAFVVGRPVHSGFALRGVNAAVLAGAIAARLEWAPELTDDSGEVPGTAASLLSVKDGKTGYDVTAPGTAFLFWNVLLHRRDPAQVLPIVADLVGQAVRGCLTDLTARAAQSGLAADAAALETDVPILTYGALLAEVAARDPGVMAHLDGVARASAGAELPERCRQMTASLWERSGRQGPAVVLGLGSIPYLATQVEDVGIEAVIAEFLAEAQARHGVDLGHTPYFAGISDMSFFGQARDAVFAQLAQDTPVWQQAGGPQPGALAQVPTVNLGPWGRDYHTPLERMHTDYGLRVLPALIEDLTRRILAA
jgi:arginine utilization protein RocB